MIRRDGVRNLLQQHRFAGARRRNNQAALPFSERREQVHYARADVVARGLKLQPLLRIQRRQVVKKNLIARFIRGLKVDGFDLNQSKILFTLMRRTHLAADRIACLQIELANLRRGYVNVVRAGQVVVVGRAEKAVTVGQNFQYALGKDVAFFFTLRLENLEDQVLLA